MPVPITPDEGGAAGAWPRPRLSKRATAMGLNYTQWGYVLAGYTLWDAGQSAWTEQIAPQLVALSLSLAVPWTLHQGQMAWSGICLLLTAGLVLFRWHGLHAYRAWQRLWASWTTPTLSVWRPVELDWQERAAEAAEEDDRESAARRATYRKTAASEANPLGWVVE